MTTIITQDFFDKYSEYPSVSRADFEAFFFNHKSVISFQKLIKHSFKDKSILKKAMTHRSFVNEFSSLSQENNEKLEFLGDSILGAIVAAEIYNVFSTLNEGQLSKLKGALVNENSLSELGILIGLDNVVLLGKGEYLSGGLTRASIISDVFEALIGAIYHDGGFVASARFLECIFSYYKKIKGCPFISEARLNSFDSKTRLQEITMKLYGNLPEYRATQNSDQTFTVELFINNKCVTTINNISKKNAEKELAKIALDRELYKGE